ncbi:PREDICTED: CASP-like protein 4D1 [Ipomoea nil]|uniref:CASP-like protein 4D1 n=1 Tax=Ipomoea nil TaxID=35883 RepID=UPI0009018A47|nr:PREDICTED: CASP-like protein 4D1 [Ipomoea nil]
MASKIIISCILVLRIFTLMILAASIALTVTNNFKAAGTKVKFSDCKSYWYILAVGAAGALYTLIQLPFAMYHVVKEKRMIRGKFLPNFDFYGDKVISFLLASGVGVGFSASVELKDTINSLMDTFEFLLANENLISLDVMEEFRTKLNKFFDREIIAIGILVGGFATMAILSILSSLNKSGKSF